MTLFTLGLLLLSATTTDGVQVEFVDSGITARMGGYRPVRAEMDQEADIVTKAPEELKAPKYGKLEFGEQSYAFLIDHDEEGNQTLYVDSNNDGDLTNDPQAEWEGEEANGMKMYAGSATIQLDADRTGKINMYRFDPKDERRAQLANTLLYYADFGYKYSVSMDGKKMETYAAGAPAEGDYLGFDRNGDGRTSRNFEMVEIGKPFNFTGTTYVLDVEDGKLALNNASEELPQLPLPPDLRVGQKALEFTATTMDGNEINFPKSYAGKVVMLDFWATWCGPCIGEIPNMKKAYADWHDKGFEILGISFDQDDYETELRKFLEEKELPWAQIYEGKGWETAIGTQHDVSGIPFVLLVDGDTGEILGTSRELRGEGLSKFIGEVLKKKQGE